MFKNVYKFIEMCSYIRIKICEKFQNKIAWRYFNKRDLNREHFVSNIKYRSLIKIMNLHNVINPFSNISHQRGYLGRILNVMKI